MSRTALGGCTTTPPFVHKGVLSLDCGVSDKTKSQSPYTTSFVIDLIHFCNAIAEKNSFIYSFRAAAVLFWGQTTWNQCGCWLLKSKRRLGSAFVRGVLNLALRSHTTSRVVLHLSFRGSGHRFLWVVGSLPITSIFNNFNNLHINLVCHASRKQSGLVCKRRPKKIEGCGKSIAIGF